jgi:hypothetical protein
MAIGVALVGVITVASIAVITVASIAGVIITRGGQRARDCRNTPADFIWDPVKATRELGNFDPVNRRRVTARGRSRSSRTVIR